MFFLFAFEINMHVRMVRAMRQQNYDQPIKLSNIGFNTRFSELLGDQGDGWQNFNTHLMFLDPEERHLSDDLANFIDWNNRVFPGGQLDLFPVSGWGRAALFVEAMEGLDTEISRDALLGQLPQVEEFTGGGIEAPLDPRNGQGPPCWNMALHDGGEWVRQHPTDGRLFECDIGEQYSDQEAAAVTALALFKAFSQSAELDVIDIENVSVTIGLFLGALTPFVFAALTMKSVGRAANKMIEEVRRQFREIPGLREGREGVRAEYAKCVDISTASALREMVAPGSLAIAIPLVLGLVSPDALGGFLAGALVTGFLLAIFMANAGGAWDNAKKYIEAGNLGGKGSEAHKAAVVGDTVGDPFKDTSGPAMNILIKVMTIVSLVFVPIFV